MHINERIKAKIESLVSNINIIRQSEDITIPALILLESMTCYFDEFDYRAFAERYTKLSLPYSYSNSLVKTTNPVLSDLESLNVLLRSTNSFRDKELADSFDVFLNALQYTQVINDQNSVKMNKEHEQNYELESYLGKIKSVDIILDEIGNFGISFDLSLNNGSMGTIDNTKRWKSQDTIKTFDPNHAKWSTLTTTYQCHKSMIELEKLMKDANVTKMSDLKNVAIEANFLEFKLMNFRILKEVL